MIVSSKNSNFIIQNLYSLINTRQLHVSFNKPKLDDQLFFDFSVFIFFEPKIVFDLQNSWSVLYSFSWDFEAFNRFHLVEKLCKLESNFEYPIWITTIVTTLMEILQFYLGLSLNRFHLVKESFKVKSNFGLPILNHHNCYHSYGLYNFI